jgi:hypothetical protein
MSTLKSGPINRLHYGAIHTGYGTDHDIWQKLMWDWYGLKPESDDGWRRGAWDLEWLAEPSCELPEIGVHYPSPVWDHARAWRDRDGEKVVTLEPYGNPFETHSSAMFADLRSLCEARGIDISFEGRSPYGASYILFLKRAETPLLGLPGRRDYWPLVNVYTFQPPYAPLG